MQSIDRFQCWPRQDFARRFSRCLAAVAFLRTYHERARGLMRPAVATPFHGYGRRQRSMPRHGDERAAKTCGHGGRAPGRSARSAIFSASLLPPRHAWRASFFMTAAACAAGIGAHRRVIAGGRLRQPAHVSTARRYEQLPLITARPPLPRPSSLPFAHTSRALHYSGAGIRLRADDWPFRWSATAILGGRRYSSPPIFADMVIAVDASTRARRRPRLRRRR